MKIENMLQRFSCISFLFKPPWYQVLCFCSHLFLKRYTRHKHLSKSFNKRKHASKELNAKHSQTERLKEASNK